MTPTSTLSPVPEAQVRRARAAQRDWEAVPISRRLRPIRALRHLLADGGEDLCAAVQGELGKPAEETLGGEILPLAAACRFLEREAARLLRPRRVPGRFRPLWLFGQADAVHRRPHGLVGIIGTWNYPLFLNGVQLVQALAAGNAVLWKPSEVAPHSARALAALFERAGFPGGLVQVLEPSREAGQALVEADINHLAFTGAASTGRRIARRLGERLIGSTLELSGCDALYVLDDADPVLAARAAWFGATINRGQTCIGVRRAFVARPVYKAFGEALGELARKAAPLRLALVSQVRQAERLLRQALAAGGHLLVPVPPPGQPAPDQCTPAVVLEARPDMDLCREDSFAPLLAVLPCDTLEEALEMDSRCGYGLGASVFTRNSGRAETLAARLRTGMVTVNDVVIPTAHPATPFGGRGASGWGVTQGAEGLLEMTVPQVVSRRGGSFRPHYQLAAGLGAANQVDLLRAMLESAHAPTVSRRWRGLLRLLRALWRGV